MRDENERSRATRARGMAGSADSRFAAIDTIPTEMDHADAGGAEYESGNQVARASILWSVGLGAFGAASDFLGGRPSLCRRVGPRGSIELMLDWTTGSQVL